MICLQEKTVTKELQRDVLICHSKIKLFLKGRFY